MTTKERHELTLEQFNQVLQEVANGEFMTRAILKVGVAEATFYTWLKKYKGFEEAYKKAQKKGQRKKEQRIRERLSDTALSVLEKRLLEGDIETLKGIGKDGNEVNLQTHKPTDYRLVIFALKRAMPEIFEQEEDAGNQEQMKAPTIHVHTTKQ